MTARGLRWPRTLFGRHLALMVCLVVLSQIASAVVWYAQVQRPRVERVAAAIRWHADTLQMLLPQVPATERAAAVSRLSAQISGVRVQTTPPERARKPTGLPHWFAWRLAARLGDDYEVRWEPLPERRIWVAVPIDGQRLWCGYAADGLMPDVSGLLIGLLISIAVLAVAGAAWLQRQVDAPLRALSLAASRVTAGGRSRFDLTDAPEELKAVAARLNDMVDALDDVARERELMLAGISHDLRTPLTKLRLGLEMLDQPAEAELIASLVRSTETADAIIDQFIDYARLGQSEPTTVEVFDDVLGEVIEALGWATPPSVRLPVSPCRVEVRRVALQRVLSNVLRNAQVHGKSPVELTATVNGDRLHVSICDHGPGIPAALREHVCQPFARGDSARGSTPGAGLGLAIAQRAAMLLGEPLTLSDYPDGGLCVRFSVCVATDEARH